MRAANRGMSAAKTSSAINSSPEAYDFDGDGAEKQDKTQVVRPCNKGL